MYNSSYIKYLQGEQLKEGMALELSLLTGSSGLSGPGGISLDRLVSRSSCSGTDYSCLASGWTS